jgi:DNA-binding HxlR family transcriptional regulator
MFANNEPNGARQFDMKRLRKRYGCPVELALDLIGGKWKMVILSRIKENPQRYADLRRDIPDISDKELTSKLKSLEQAGLIRKTRDSDDGRMSHYILTDRAENLRPALQALYDWGAGLAEELDIPAVPRPYVFDPRV